jgi:hypothetical protein
VALALVYLFALRVCGFTGGVVKGKSRVCGSSTRVFVCLASMWLYGQCYGKSRVVTLAHASLYFWALCVSLGL